MKHLTAADILKQQGARQAKRYEAFELILENCYKIIQKCIQVTRNVYSCCFEVPEFIIGFPLYDLNECIQYIVRILVSKGFAVQYMFPRMLFVSWAPKASTNALPMPNNSNSSNISNSSNSQKVAPAKKRFPAAKQTLKIQSMSGINDSNYNSNSNDDDNGKKIFVQKTNRNKGKFMLDLS